MAHIFANGVLETANAPGTGAVTLTGAVSGYVRFSARCATGDTVHYRIEAVNGLGIPTGLWELGRGTYSAANTLTRTTVYESSNSNAAENFGSAVRVSITVLSPLTASQVVADWLLGLGLNNVNNTADLSKTVYSAQYLRHQANPAGNPMVFNWNGVGGTPSWVWGGSDGTNMYVYSPSAFSVNYANSVGSVQNAGGGTITSTVNVNGNLYAVNGLLWNGSATGLAPNGGYAVSGGIYRQNPIVNCQSGQGDVSDFSSYHQPGVASFFQMNVGGAGAYFRFHNNGTGYSNSGWTVHSDRRTKSKIRRITNAMKKIRKLNGYTFIKEGTKPYWRRTPFRRMGYLAQEWLGVMPEAVDVPYQYDAEKDEGPILSMADGSTGALLLEGLKETDDTVAQILQEIKALKAENKKLRRMIEAKK